MRKIKHYVMKCHYREKERKCGPDGFVDSTKYRQSFNAKSEKKGGGSGGGGGGGGGSGGPKPHTVVDLMLKKERDQKEYDKRLKVIEVG